MAQKALSKGGKVLTKSGILAKEETTTLFVRKIITPANRTITIDVPKRPIDVNIEGGNGQGNIGMVKRYINTAEGFNNYDLHIFTLGSTNSIFNSNVILTEGINWSWADGVLTISYPAGYTPKFYGDYKCMIVY